MKRLVMICMAVALVALPTKAGWIHHDQQIGDEPQSAFQSTSTMTPSGSAYSSNPVLDDSGAAPAPIYAPRKTTIAPPPPPFVDENDTGNTPVGDAVLPMMLMAAAAAGAIALRRRKALVDAELRK